MVAVDTASAAARCRAVLGRDLDRHLDGGAAVEAVADVFDSPSGAEPDDAVGEQQQRVGVEVAARVRRSAPPGPRRPRGRCGMPGADVVGPRLRGAVDVLATLASPRRGRPWRGSGGGGLSRLPWSSTSPAAAPADLGRALPRRSLEPGSRDPPLRVRSGARYARGGPDSNTCFRCIRSVCADGVESSPQVMMRRAPMIATMELRQLEYFVAVAEELHFSRAAAAPARRAAVGQRADQGARAELGLPLFERSSQAVLAVARGPRHAAARHRAARRRASAAAAGAAERAAPRPASAHRVPGR